MTPYLSVVIPHLNDSRLPHTLGTLLLTTPKDEVEIIVVDDGSAPEAIASARRLGGDHVLWMYNEANLGPARSRMRGAVASSAEWLLLTDAHMEFSPGWYELWKTWAAVVEPEDVLCGTYIDHDVFTKRTWTKGGAKLYPFFVVDPRTLVDPDVRRVLTVPGKDQSALILYPDHQLERAGETAPYEVSCPMGACYFVRRARFYAMGGYRGLHRWGGEEQMLALKTWLGGGRVLVMPDVRIMHFYDSSSRVWRQDDWWLTYNLLAIVQLLFPEVPRKMVLDYVRRLEGTAPAFERLAAMRLPPYPHKGDFYEFLDRFQLPQPELFFM